MSFTRGFRSHNGFPKPGEELKDALGRHSREGWTHVKDHDSVYLEGKQYRNMKEWSRPCAICAGPVYAFEKSSMVDANSRFSNRTCKDHRGLLPAADRGFIVWSPTAQAIVAGPSCGVTTTEAKALEECQAELKAAYDANMDLAERYGALQRQLAKYELGPAMQACENNSKLPWQSS